MRMLQYMGFNDYAKDFLKPKGTPYQAISYKVYADGSKSDVHEKNGNDFHYTSEKIGFSDQWYGEGADLHEYTITHGTSTGQKFYDGIQAAPWSSGPVIFMALYYDKECTQPIPGTTWTDKEIQNYLN